ncbi:MAG: hypothetical protein PHT69_11165 [Bacteroidales bacterium]|nr:hypothetical protein [Bacteroidales bacterium]
MCLGVIFMPVTTYCQLPLLSDDTGTQGKGLFQFELSNGLDYNSEHRCNEKTTEIAPVFTYGLHDKVDVVLCTPYLFTEVHEDTLTTAAHGFS